MWILKTLHGFFIDSRSLQTTGVGKNKKFGIVRFPWEGVGRGFDGRLIYFNDA